MSNLAIVAFPATSLAMQLASAARPVLLKEYRGVSTPRELDVPQEEMAALTAGAAVHDMGWLRRVAVRGEDRFRWLSGMVTNMVTDLPEHGGAWNLVLNAQGRIQGDLMVWRDGDQLEIELDASQAEKLLAHLDQFIIMDDVELVQLNTDATTAETSVGLTGPKASEVLVRAGLPALPEPMTQTRVEWNGFDLRLERGYGALAEHYVIWVAQTGLVKLWRMLKAVGASPVGCDALDALRIAEGIPVYGIDIAERDLPQETSQMRALHFSKGCYLGQEIVERIRSRGSVHRHLKQLELDGPLPVAGTELTLGGAAMGQITSAADLPLAAGARRFALAMIRGEAEAKNEPLSYATESGTGTARTLTAAPSFL
ncbi:MAG: folate-binding protein [Terracidiphilus sp.]|nr:folate-binding protein [Terracidiphilus sp.]